LGIAIHPTPSCPELQVLAVFDEEALFESRRDEFQKPLGHRKSITKPPFDQYDTAADPIFLQTK
jgi:hypothetical protein